MFTCTHCDGSGRLPLEGTDRLEALAEATDLKPDDEDWEPTERCGRCGGKGHLTLEDLNWELDTAT